MANFGRYLRGERYSPPADDQEARLAYDALSGYIASKQADNRGLVIEDPVLAAGNQTLSIILGEGGPFDEMATLVDIAGQPEQVMLFQPPDDLERYICLPDAGVVGHVDQGLASAELYAAGPLEDPAALAVAKDMLRHEFELGGLAIDVVGPEEVTDLILYLDSGIPVSPDML